MWLSCSADILLSVLLCLALFYCVHLSVMQQIYSHSSRLKSAPLQFPSVSILFSAEDEPLTAIVQR